MSIFEREPQPYSAIERVARGQRAADLLSDPLLGEAYEEAEWLFVEGWAKSPDPKVQSECWAGINALDALRQRLAAIVSDGIHAAASQE